MKARYQALLVAPDGDYVLDCKSETVEEVVEKIGNLGSRWYFYPFRFVITTRYSTDYVDRVSPRQRIVEAPELFEELEGKTVGTVLKLAPEMAAYLEELDKALRRQSIEAELEELGLPTYVR